MNISAHDLELKIAALQNREKPMSDNVPVVGEHGVKTDAKGVKARFPIWDSGSVIFSYAGFQTGMAGEILLNFANL